MPINPNETVIEDIKPLLQLKRPLLPIDKYAAREGITRRIVEEYGRLGVLQLRRCKGKTYVVDVPLSPYLPMPEGLQILQENDTMASPGNVKRSQSVNNTSQVRMISELSPSISTKQAQKTIGDMRRIAAKPIKPDIGAVRADANPGLAKEIFSQASRVSNKLAGKNRHEFNNGKPVSTREEVSQADQRQFDTDVKQAGVQRIRQIAVVFIILFLFAAFIAYLGLFMNQKVHSGRLDQTTASVQSVYDDFVRTNQHLATLQGKIVESTADIEWVKNELKASKTESAGVRSELTLVKRSLETIQQYNAAALGQLREQLQQLTTQLGKVIKNSETLADSNTPGK